MTQEYDVVIIGGGAVAENVADRVVQGGLTAVLIESELVGGECSYWACMPSKALLRSGSALRAAQRLDGAKQAVSGDLDVDAVLQRRTRIAHNWDDASQVDWAASAGIDVVRGHGRLIGTKLVDVGAEDGSHTHLTARHAVVLSTGSDPVLPDIPGLADAAPWTSRDATSATRIPGSLAIIGGGVVGVEMATAYASLGCTVTMIVRGGLLSGHEDFAVEAVTKGLKGLGVTILTGTPSAVTRNGSVSIVVGAETVTADEVLVATGRQPRTVHVGLETVGLSPGDWLQVDDTMLVAGTEWLYATGDVNHRALLTHQGKYQARIAGDVIAARARGDVVNDQPWGSHVATADHHAVPQVVFSDPEIASVGMTSEAAHAAGLDVRVVDYDLGWVAGASIHADDYAGHARMIVDEKRKVILGFSIVGQDVSELIHAATIAVVAEVPLDRLWHAVPAYPTMNEIWLRLLETYRSEA